MLYVIARRVAMLFPSPREVDREIYGNMKLEYGSKSQAFPAPRKVDRYLYMITNSTYLDFYELFPAPSEVDREIYLMSCIRCIRL